MEVILLEKIRNLGDLGDKVSVKSGFGRNFLIPQGKAVSATAENVAEFEQRRAELEAKAKTVLEYAKQRADDINALSTVEIAVKASDEGKLYGSVGTDAISEALAASGIEVEKKEVILPEGAIRSLGEFDIQIQLHSDVVADVHLAIIAEA